jgi:hypothetical protein
MARKVIEGLEAFPELQQLAPPIVVPTAERGVQLEWKRQKRELEVAFGPRGEIEFLTIEGERLDEGPLKVEEATAHVRRLLAWLDRPSSRVER